MFNNIEYQKQYYLDNIESEKERGKRYRKENKEKIRKRHEIYYQKNKDKILTYIKGWIKKNPEKVSKIVNRCSRKKYRLDHKFNLNRRIGPAIKRSLKDNKAGRHWEDLVGYTLDDLINRLKETMPKGHTWQDYLEGKLHIDHIIPITAYNFTKPEHIDFKRCWSLNNLQLLPAKENRSKYNKLDKAFQPSLAI